MSIDKPFAITLDRNTSLANHTGSWRSKRPVYLDRLPPCNATCPAGKISRTGCSMPNPATMKQLGGR
ncbi:hypothetical protein [Thiothrix subterranea]|uniref:hypothetical protein n=1 Tax=Thiothrix subterranea TaxID=2735563 RepID=UPI00280BEDF6|nr:hypothetical protein [Thiothrix subterranea]